MMNKLKTYLIECGVGLAIAVTVILLNLQSGHSVMHLLCDGCFVAAVLLIGSGGIMFCRDKGAFDIFGYGMKTALGLLIPGVALSKSGEKVDYYTYCEQKAENRRHVHHPMLVGFGYLAMAVAFLLMYAI